MAVHSHQICLDFTHPQIKNQSLNVFFISARGRAISWKPHLATNHSSSCICRCNSIFSLAGAALRLPNSEFHQTHTISQWAPHWAFRNSEVSPTGGWTNGQINHLKKEQSTSSKAKFWTPQISKQAQFGSTTATFNPDKIRQSRCDNHKGKGNGQFTNNVPLNGGSTGGWKNLTVKMVNPALIDPG